MRNCTQISDVFRFTTVSPPIGTTQGLSSVSPFLYFVEERDRLALSEFEIKRGHQIVPRRKPGIARPSRRMDALFEFSASIRKLTAAAS